MLDEETFDEKMKRIAEELADKHGIEAKEAFDKLEDPKATKPTLTIASSGPGLTDAQKAFMKKKASAKPDNLTLHRKLFEQTVGFGELEQIAQHMMLGQGTPGSASQLANARIGPCIVDFAMWTEENFAQQGPMGAAKCLARALATTWVLGLHTLVPPEHVPILATQLSSLISQEFTAAIVADAEATKVLTQLYTEKKVMDTLGKTAEAAPAAPTVPKGLSVAVDNTKEKDDEKPV